MVKLPELLLQKIGTWVDKSRTFSSTLLGSKVEDILKKVKPSKEVEALLFAAARLECYRNVIKPCLNVGSTVICDRYLMDAYAYSCNSMTGVSDDYIYKINMNYRSPDITFLLDMDPRLSLDRLDRPKDHYEKEDFLKSVREQYLIMVASKELYFKDQNWIVLDGSQPVNVIQSLVWDEVQKIL